MISLMKRLTLSCFILLSGLSISAQSQHSIRTRLSLAGEWKSSLGQCRLPGTTDENQLGYRNTSTEVTHQLTRLYSFSGKVVYERDIIIPDSLEGKRFTLIMERTKPSTLWLDGDSIGSLGHIYAPHCYDLPLLKTGKHHLAICIDNSANAVPKEIQGSHAWTDATQTNWNGILGNFYIEAKDSTYIDDVQVYPLKDLRTVNVKVAVYAHRSGVAELRFKVNAWNTDKIKKELLKGRKVTLKPGLNTVELSMDMGDNPLTWSEFHPSLYNLEVNMLSGKYKDSQNVDFGIRHFSIEKNQFVLNGYKTFLRGKHDACVFPLTGYAPMDVEAWRKVFQIAKRYGINHYRCHSYTPPEAALLAADIEGIYFQVELPLWGSIKKENTQLNSFLKREGDMILRQLGNHPSFMMLGLGNELNGDVEVMRNWLDDFRRQDKRHLYCFGSNNNLGWMGPVEGEDFFVTCRVGGGEGYTTHVRTSFAYVDAEKGGILNNTRPNTLGNYAQAIARCPYPVIGHETGQFQIYPNYHQISKYHGILYPYNLEVFRKRLEKNGLSAQSDEFALASGKFAIECYKADIEYALRTPNLGGFQMLDLQDYPGQGTALVGVLDAFMDSKGVVEADVFRGFCAPVVPLALMPDYCFSTKEPLNIELALSNYEEKDWNSSLKWSLVACKSNWKKDGVISVQAKQGNVSTIGSISVSLSDIKIPQKLILTLTTGSYHNSYNLWVYPEMKEDERGIYVTSVLDKRTKELLEKGGKILFIPEHDQILKQSVGGMFTPDYWNYSMFKTISERAGKEVSPGTLSILTDSNHALYKNFPTESYSDWQWWSIMRASRPLILNSLPKSYRPLIQVIDNIERNHKLGILFELAVGKGKILVCMTDLSRILQYPEGNQYRIALLRYMKSDSFLPVQKVGWKELNDLFVHTIEQDDIQGVENISDYNKTE